MQKDGTTYVQGKKLSAEELAAKLKAAKDKGKVDVVIAGDKEVALQKLLDVMDVVRGEGINSVGIAASKQAAAGATDGAAPAK